MTAPFMPANPRLLLVDFEPRNVQAMMQKLMAAGYEVVVAWDGLEALEMFRGSPPDAVLIEAMLPKKHGFEVCREMKRDPRGRSVPVVMTASLYRGRKYRNIALHDCGCDEYLERPFDDATLFAVLSRVVARAQRRHH